jgi:translation initiation factor IF-3
VNETIRARELRVIDENGNQVGVISRQDALARARQAGLDLVEISPNADPPVAKIVDWGKYNYQKTKQRQKNRKNTKTLDLKQIRFGIKIGQHDLDVKLKKIREFLEEGHKVRITAFFRGREMAHQEIGYKLLENVYEQIADISVIDQQPQLSGKYLSIVVRVSNNAKAKNAQRDGQADQEDQHREAAPSPTE